MVDCNIHSKSFLDYKLSNEKVGTLEKSTPKLTILKLSDLTKQNEA